MMYKLSRQEQRQQMIAIAAIEGIKYTPEELALFDYFDSEKLDEATCLRRLEEFCNGTFEIPRAA